MTTVAVLEVGGTHATAVRVETATWTIRSDAVGRVDLRADAPPDALLDALASCVRASGSVDGLPLVVAIPGPFDYAAGLGRFRDVGKFDALDGVDVGAGLRIRLDRPPERLVFVNDAAAFGLGEWLAGAARGARRAVAITLGTGVGSAFVADGAVVTTGPSVPPQGHVYRLTVDGRPLESVVSRRAMLARYGDPGADVRDVAERVPAGDERARAAFTEPLAALGATLAPWLARFGAETLVVGGAMSESWTLVEPALRRGLGGLALPVRRSRDPGASAAIGAAWHAVGGERR